MFQQFKKVMVFGTFDLVHPGHVFFLAQAKQLGGHLTVSIARDTNVERIKKQKPMFEENKRLADVTALNIADQALLGDLENYINHIVKVAPDIICLGYDQSAYTESLEKDLKAAGLKTQIVRLKAFSPEIYKSSKLKVSSVQKGNP